MKTTLNKIRAHSPCEDGWKKLLSALKKTSADDEPLALISILESNGLNDALWCLRAVDGYDREMRLFAVWCARQVQHLMTNQRSSDALDIAERFANGEATDAELKAAWEAALTAAWEAARAAAWDTAWTAARAAAWEAARDAAWEAALTAAWEAARAAAWDTAWTAARDTAWTAAWAAAREAQKQELRRLLSCIDAGVKYEIKSWVSP